MMRDEPVCRQRQVINLSQKQSGLSQKLNPLTFYAPFLNQLLEKVLPLH
jgi:hypothetical protein